MGVDILRLVDPFRMTSTATKAITGRSIESWFGGKKSDSAAPVAAPSASATGNLTDEEAKAASSSRLFRIGTFFTSPTGTLNTAPRKGAKLIGT